MRTCYHVTTKDALLSIMEQGLIPQCGERSSDIGEPVPRIYLFPTVNDMETALMSWFGELFDDDTELVILEVTVPADLLVEGEVEYECYCYQNIPAECIRPLPFY